jgi:hypothetical protein
MLFSFIRFTLGPTSTLFLNELNVNYESVSQLLDQRTEEVLDSITQVIMSRYAGQVSSSYIASSDQSAGRVEIG